MCDPKEGCRVCLSPKLSLGRNLGTAVCWGTWKWDCSFEQRLGQVQENS